MIDNNTDASKIGSKTAIQVVLLAFVLLCLAYLWTASSNSIKNNHWSEYVIGIIVLIVGILYASRFGKRADKKQHLSSIKLFLWGLWFAFSTTLVSALSGVVPFLIWLYFVEGDTALYFLSMTLFIILVYGTIPILLAAIVFTVILKRRLKGLNKKTR